MTNGSVIASNVLQSSLGSNNASQTCPITARRSFRANTAPGAFTNLILLLWHKVWESVTWELQVLLWNWTCMSQVWKTQSISRMLNNAFPCYWPPWLFPRFPFTVPPSSDCLWLLVSNSVSWCCCIQMPKEYTDYTSATNRCRFHALHLTIFPQALPCFKHIRISSPHLPCQYFSLGHFP